MKRKNINVYLIQETWISDDYSHLINEHHIFHHGTPSEESAKTKGRTKGGVAIILSPARATEAWKRAGQPDPIKSGMHLSPATGINQQERSKFLIKIDNLYDKLDKRSGSILIAGCDINSSIGTRDLVFGREDSLAFTQDKDILLGPHGINYLNEGGTDLLQILKAKSLVAATTFFKHEKYTKWRQNNSTDSEREEIGDDSHIRNPSRNPFQNRSEYHLDQFLTQKKHLSKILDARNMTDGAPSDHKALKLVLRIATKLTKPPAKFNIQGEKKKSKPFVLKKLQNKTIQQNFNDEIYDKLPFDTEAPISYDDFIKTTMQAAESVAAGEGRVSKDWFNNLEDILLQAIGLQNYWHDLWIKGNIPGARAK
eukprot:scaffold1423_cov39-Attheya_sp.AAC.5